MEVIESARGTEAAKRCGLDIAVAAAFEQFAQGREVLRGHRFLDAISPQALDRSAHEDAGFVYRVAQRLAGVTENHEVSSLGHEGTHVADVASNDDVDALHRNSAS